MAQDFQLIGQASPELDRVALERQGWQDSPPESQTRAITDASDFSAYHRRTNRAVQGYRLGEEPGPVQNWAGHVPEPMAGYSVSPAGDKPHPQPEAGY